MATCNHGERSFALLEVVSRINNYLAFAYDAGMALHRQSCSLANS